MNLKMLFTKWCAFCLRPNALIVGCCPHCISWHRALALPQPWSKESWLQTLMWTISTLLVLNIEKLLISRSQIAKFMGPTWGPPRSCRPQMGPMNLAIRGIAEQGVNNVEHWYVSDVCMGTGRRKYQCLPLPTIWQPLNEYKSHYITSLIARFMGPTWGPSWADRTQVGPMLTLWTLLSGISI